MWIKVQGENKIVEIKGEIFVENLDDRGLVCGTLRNGSAILGTYSPKKAEKVFREIWIAIASGRNWFEMPEA
ncbi:hypothetical protein SAMN02746089_02519 [Caldanaerobius fijiensis DSM 17918]|uniref:Uncharacterized protein n=1 Tax=Caldanaerobius fijiensis DSM 17918 TaxID=1121256 RepID=A0A1M5EC40_9THEO|nr:hypothetical protein [Caldanaerobius fijiensis]SHF76641.1 hypothetical protein SAMN02746089_02519 [Caldanaerobius fijiensis DSM 17918]